MNPLRDDMPEIPQCPHCGHDGDGLQWAFPDIAAPPLSRVQCACLACGVHGSAVASYDEAARLFEAGEVEVPA